MANPLYTEPSTKIDKSIHIQVYRRTGREVEIVWSDLPNKYFPTTDSFAILEVSDSPESDFSSVISIYRDTPPYYIDNATILTYYRSPVVYYRIRIPQSNTISPVYNSEQPYSMYGLEIAKRHAIMLRNGHWGNLMYLFIRRRTKDRCPECWDSIRNQRTKGNCPRCLNTGYDQGYYDPLPIYVSVSPESTTTVQAVDGTVITGTIQGWTAGYPRINMGDILVDSRTREIWHVSQISLNTHKRVPTKQDLVLQHQDDDLSIFKVLERVPNNPKKEDTRRGDTQL